MLTEKQLRGAYLMAEGMNISEISREINISRTSIYAWKEKDEFITELNRLVQKNKSEANRQLTSNLGKYISELEKIAFNSKNEKTKSQALMYLIDRCLGKSATKVDANISEEQQEEINWDDITLLKKTS